METKELLEDLKFARKYYKRALKYKKYKTFVEHNLYGGFCSFFAKKEKIAASFQFKENGFYGQRKKAYLFPIMLLDFAFEYNVKKLIDRCILARYKFLCAAIKELEEMIANGIEYTSGRTSKLIVNGKLDKSKL